IILDENGENLKGDYIFKATKDREVTGNFRKTKDEYLDKDKNTVVAATAKLTLATNDLEAVSGTFSIMGNKWGYLSMDKEVADEALSADLRDKAQVVRTGLYHKKAATAATVYVKPNGDPDAITSATVNGDRENKFRLVGFEENGLMAEGIYGSELSNKPEPNKFTIFMKYERMLFANFVPNTVYNKNATKPSHYYVNAEAFLDKNSFTSTEGLANLIVTGNGTVPADTQAKITATVAPGYRLKSWVIDACGKTEEEKLAREVQPTKNTVIDGYGNIAATKGLQGARIISFKTIKDMSVHANIVSTRAFTISSEINAKPGGGAVIATDDSGKDVTDDYQNFDNGKIVLTPQPANDFVFLKWVSQSGAILDPTLFNEDKDSKVLSFDLSKLDESFLGVKAIFEQQKPKEVKVSKIIANAGTQFVPLAFKKTRTLSASWTPADATIIGKTWKSSTTSVATIDEKTGRIVAKNKVGTTVMSLSLSTPTQRQSVGVLIAVYNPKKSYSISFKKPSKSYGTLKAKAKKYKGGSKVKVSLKVKKGKTFIGWYDGVYCVSKKPSF
ncbi:MAG: Ig-like domain-containing protein, partial [Anaerovoracaceae bacterium]